MRYTIGQLAALSDVSPRALRLYEQKGLLQALRGQDNGYRLYGQEQVDRLQMILFYRRLDMSLSDIKALLEAPDFDRQQALERHLQQLKEQRRQIDALLITVQNTLSEIKGERKMSDAEKFEGLKQQRIDENEQKYGQELRDRYGSQTIEAANRKVKSMSRQQWDTQEQLTLEVLQALKEAAAQGDPAGEKARSLCQLHRQWLMGCWPEGMYTPQAHLELARGYLADGRFTAYYDGPCGQGATAFLVKALEAFLAQ